MLTRATWSNARPRFLPRLLLVHGALADYRLVRLIKYSFYKNITFAFMFFFYQFFNGVSGQARLSSSLSGLCLGPYMAIKEDSSFADTHVMHAHPTAPHVLSYISSSQMQGQQQLWHPTNEAAARAPHGQIQSRTSSAGTKRKRCDGDHCMRARQNRRCWTA
jgi:hypothetical protein